MPAVTLGRLASGVVLVLALTSCSGDGDDSSGNATKGEFCDAFNDLVDDVLGAGVDESDGMVTAIKEWAADIEELGTPEEMPDDARRGFELFVDHAADLDEDMGIEDLQSLGDDLSDDDRADGTAFTAWTQENCPIT